VSYFFHPEAEGELFEAIEYFAQRDQDLGLDFSREVFDMVDLIVEFPQAWSPITERFRRCLLDRFPYGLAYEIVNDEIFVVAIMHLSREPDYWQSRIKE
jgi:plasmid stabilization system protein ParE